MCSAHATVRGLVGELVRHRPGNGEDVVVDMEAGLEHLSRGTGRHVDLMITVLEPYYRALETGRRVAKLASDLEIERTVAVANKIRDESDLEAIAEFCERHGLETVGELPYDRTLVEAEREGAAPVDYDPDAPAVTAIRRLAEDLAGTVRD